MLLFSRLDFQHSSIKQTTDQMPQFGKDAFHRAHSTNSSVLRCWSHYVAPGNDGFPFFIQPPDQVVTPTCIWENKLDQTPVQSPRNYSVPLLVLLLVPKIVLRVISMKLLDSLRVVMLKWLVDPLRVAWVVMLKWFAKSFESSDVDTKMHWFKYSESAKWSSGLTVVE